MKCNLFTKWQFQKLRTGHFLPFDKIIMGKIVANRACYHYFCLIITIIYLPNED
jgi:hypothetical protein